MGLVGGKHILNFWHTNKSCLNHEGEVSRRKRIIKIRAVINEIENKKKNRKKINKTKKGF